MKYGFVLICLFVLQAMLMPNAPSPLQSSQSTAILFDPIDITCYMSESGSTLFRVKSTVHNLGATVVSNVTFRVDSLNVYSPSAKWNSTTAPTDTILYSRSTGIHIILGTGLPVGESADLEIQFTAGDLQSSLEPSIDPAFLEGNFIFYIRPMNTFRNLTFTAYLMPHAFLSDSSVLPLFPDTFLNLTDGSSLAFTWLVPELLPGQERVIIIRYQIPNVDYTPSESRVGEFLLIAALSFILGIAVTRFAPKISQRLREARSVHFVGVTPEEESLLEIIKARGGSCPQKDLYQELDLSQAKVSIILSHLEDVGLVRRFRDGRENMVHLLEEKSPPSS